MKPARSGELSVLLGRPGAQREQGVLKERQRSGKTVTANCHCQACDSPCVKCPTPCVWLAPGPWLLLGHDEPEDFARPLPARRAAP